MFPRQDRDTTGVYSRDGISGTGTTGSVVKMRVPGSISRATAVNSPSPALSCFDPITHHVYTAINRTGKEPIEAQKDKITATTFAHLAPHTKDQLLKPMLRLPLPLLQKRRLGGAYIIFCVTMDWMTD